MLIIIKIVSAEKSRTDSVSSHSYFILLYRGKKIFILKKYLKQSKTLATRGIAGIPAQMAQMALHATSDTFFKCIVHLEVWVPN